MNKPFINKLFTKRNILLASVLLIVLVIMFSAIWICRSSLPVKEVHLPIAYYEYKSFEELNNRCDLVAVVTMEKDFKDYEPIIYYSENGFPDACYTIADVRVEKIIKGEY